MEEQMKAKEFTKEAYVASLSLKTIRVWRPSEADCQSLKSPRVWSLLESEVKNLELVISIEDTSLQKEYKSGTTTISEEL